MDETNQHKSCYKKKFYKFQFLILILVQNNKKAIFLIWKIHVKTFKAVNMYELLYKISNQMGGHVKSVEAVEWTLHIEFFIIQYNLYFLTHIVHSFKILWTFDQTNNSSSK